MTEREYLRCSDAPGYVSEIFDGVVQVSPSGKLYHHSWQSVLGYFLQQFAHAHPDVFNRVLYDNDVFIPGRPGPTRPRPDISVYREFPHLHQIIEATDWSDVCPVLVVEVISRRRARKDTVRNRALYWYAGGIAEYWIIDTRQEPTSPALLALTREPGKPDWTEARIAFGETYSSVAFPGLSIDLQSLSQGI